MGTILLMMTVLGTILAVILLVAAVLTKKAWLKNFVLGGLTVWFSFYVIIFLISSVFSEEKTLALNQPKEFCGFYLDCHLHAAVTEVRKTKQIGNLTAQGEFYIVKVKIFSDAKQATLNLIQTKAEVFDANGRRYTRREDAEKFLPTAQISLDQEVAAGAAFEKEIVFDIDENAANARLLVTEGYGIDKIIEAVLVGDEDSLFHKRVYFSLKS